MNLRADSAHTPVRSAMFATILAAASGVGAAHEPLTGQVPTHGDARRAVAEIAGAATQRGFAGQVLAVRDGAVLFHEAFGLSDEAAGTATTVETVYAIGSVTKQFTRVSILKLEEDGRLDTSDTISRHLEGLPADKRDITIQQVLDMRAGFHEYHDDTGDHQAMNRDEALRRIYAQELRFEPGTERAYSNSGYSLLAAIVENVSGMTFPEYVRTELLDPLGLDAIGFHGDDRWSDARAARGRGGAREGDNAPHTWPVVTWALQGAGGMVASAEDLSEWIRALRTGRVLGPVALTAAYGDGPAVYAGGDDFGFQTGVVEVDAGDDFVVVNTNNGSDVLEIALDAVEAMTGERVDFGPQRVVDDDEGPAPGGGPGGGIPDSPRARAATAFMEALRAGTNDAFDALVRDSFARELRDEFTMDGHREMLITLKDVVDTADGVGLSPLAEFTVAIMLQPGTRRIILDLEESPPHGIIGIRLEGS